jgi:hypothetical protein
VKKLFLALLLLVFGLFLTACQENSSGAYPTLPVPNVRVEILPTATATEIPEEETPVPLTPTVATQAEVQAWPTLDEEEYLVSQLDALFNKMERMLNSADTRLKP